MPRVEVFFFCERIWPCHAGGYWFRVEAITVQAIATGKGFNETALGTSSTKLGARWKLRRWKRQLTREAAEQESEVAG